VPRRKGHSDVARVMTKLRAIGVTDVDQLFKGIDKNTMNQELQKHGYVGFSREAIDSIRKRKGFMQNLKDVSVPHIRQIGGYAPLPQMLSQRRLGSPSGSPQRRGGGMTASMSEGCLRAGSDSNRSSTTDEGGFLLARTVSDEDAPRLRGARVDLRRERRKAKVAAKGVRSPSSASPLRSPSPSSPTGATAASETGSSRSNLRSPSGVLHRGNRARLPSRSRSPLSGDDADDRVAGGHTGMSAAAIDTIAEEGPPKADFDFCRSVSVGSAAASAPVANSFWPSVGISNATAFARMSSSAHSSRGSSSPPTLGRRQTGPGASGSAGLAAAAAADNVFNQSLGTSNASGVLGLTLLGGSSSAVHLPVTEESMLQDVRAMYREGCSMTCDTKERTGGLWLCSRVKSPLEQGEDMLREQAALEDRQRLMRTLTKTGEDLEFRGHIAKNIQMRLSSEAKREAGRGPALAVNQQCINIKKQLEGLVKARGELKGLRAKVQLLVEGDSDLATCSELGALFTGQKFQAAPDASRKGSPSSTYSKRRSMSKTFELPALASVHR